MNDFYDDENDLNSEQINQKADELAKKFYEENQKMIDEITDDSKEILSENHANSEEILKSKPSKRKKILASIIGFSALILLVILIASNVINMGNKIMQRNNYLGISFYVLVAILMIVLIFIPFMEMFFLPSYHSLFSMEENGKSGKIKANVKKILWIVNRHQAEWNISEKNQQKFSQARLTLQDKKANEKQLQEAYRYIYKTYIKKDVMNLITHYSNKIFLATAVVQSGKIDSFVLLTSYVKMSKDILKYCGYRISYVRFCKLMIEVLKMIFAATKLSQIDFSAVFPKMMMNSLAKIPGAKVVVNSLADGVSNALLFYKTGVMLEEYLLSDNQNLIHQWGVSIKETARYMLLGLVGEIIKKIAEFTTIALKKTIDGIQNFFLSIQKQITSKKENKKLVSAG